MSLKEITDHIYGRANVITRTDRPNMFIKELSIYIDYYQSKLNEVRNEFSEKQRLYLELFATNLESGIAYYTKLFKQKKLVRSALSAKFLKELELNTQKLAALGAQLQTLQKK